MDKFESKKEFVLLVHPSKSDSVSLEKIESGFVNKEEAIFYQANLLGDLMSNGLNRRDEEKLIVQTIRGLKREVKAQQGEIDKLVGALEAIANKETASIMSNGNSSKYVSHEQGWEMVASFAKQALAEIKSEEK